MPISSVYSKGSLASYPLNLIFLYYIILKSQTKWFESIYLWNIIISITWHSGYYRNYPAFLISTSQSNQSSRVVWKQAALGNAALQGLCITVFHCLWLWDLSQGGEHLFFLFKAPFLLYTSVVNIVALCVIPLHFSKWLSQPIVSASVHVSPEGVGGRGMTCLKFNS